MHDRNGVPLKVGDVVLIEATIGTTYACEDYCNVTLKIGSEQPNGPANVQSSVTLNARQVLMFKRAETIVPVPVVLADLTPAAPTAPTGPDTPAATTDAPPAAA